MAVVGELERRAAQAKLEAGAVARHGGEQVAQREAGIDRLVAPPETPGRPEAARDRGPGEREFDIGQGLGDAALLVVNEHRAVGDPDLGERQALRALRTGLEGARQAVGERRPVRPPLGIERHRDARTDERYVGDLDAPDEQRQEPQLRDQPLGGERRLGAAIVAERHLAETDARGKQRYRGLAVEPRIEPGDAADLGLDGVAHVVGGDQDRNDRDSRDRHDDQGGDAENQPLQPGGRDHGGCFRYCTVRSRFLRWDLS